MDDSQGKGRLDAFLSTAMPDASRAKLQAAIREGLVLVNGVALSQAGPMPCAGGDTVRCQLPPPAPVEAAPEGE